MMKKFAFVMSMMKKCAFVIPQNSHDENAPFRNVRGKKAIGQIGHIGVTNVTQSFSHYSYYTIFIGGCQIEYVTDIT